MKHFWCALVLLAALGIGCYLATARVAALTEQTASLLDTARTAAQADRLTDAQHSVEEANAFWRRNEGFWGTVLRHAETDEISCQFEVLRQRAEARDREELLCGIAELQAMLRHVSDMEQPYYYNFF